MNKQSPLTKQGPKRRRKTRRQLREGQYSQWAHCWTHFKRERIEKLAPTIDDKENND